jgi:hypothetical protein
MNVAFSRSGDKEWKRDIHGIASFRKLVSSDRVRCSEVPILRITIRLTGLREELEYYLYSSIPASCG